MRKFAMILLVAFALAAPRAFAQAGAQKTLDIYYIDTEHGKSVLYVSPSGESVLVDAGNAGNNDRDAKRVLAVLKAADVHVIDFLVVTHFHSDHVGGVPGVLAGMQVRQIYDHGPYMTQLQPAARAVFEAYMALRREANASVPKPGDKIPIKGVTMTFISSGRKLITTPVPGVPGAGAPNPLCNTFVHKDDYRGVENDENVDFITQYGNFRVVDAGDLLWDQEHALVCPRNLVGTADLLATTGHGQEYGNSPLWVHAIRPRITVMNNGPNDKQGPTFKTFRSSPGFEDFWQTHASKAQADENSPDDFIASMEDSVDHPGYYIKVSAKPDGSFTVTNSRNGFTKDYPAKKGSAPASKATSTPATSSSLK